jgi:ATP-dependent helicase/DNAse subunit B
VPLKLPDGRRIQVVGRMDRIDQIADTPSTFTIWDYKTGSSTRYTGSDPFRKGRNVQHVLYLDIVRARLHHKISRHATVAYFGYFFPGGRGRGDRRRFPPEALQGGHDMLARLTDIAANGVFLATNTLDDCMYCDYRAICGDVAAVTSGSQQKLGNEENAQLQPFKELRKNGTDGGRNATS